MKRVMVVSIFIIFLLNLFAWQDGLKVAGDFNSWTLVNMEKDVDGDWEYFYSFKAAGTDDPSEFKFQRLGDDSNWYWMGDNNDDHYAAVGEDNINIGGVQGNESYLFTYVGSNDRYDMSHLTEFKIVGNPVGGWTSVDAESMTKVEDATNGNYWTYTFTASSTGDKFFRLWPNGIQVNYGATWVFGSNSTTTDLNVGIDTETVCGIGSEEKALYFNANEIGDWTIAVRPHEKIVYVNKGADSTLPVELSTFTAMLGENGPQLNWTTQSEENNAGWNVYRGETETAWQQQNVLQLNSAMGLIEGAGTTSEPTDYQFEDIMPTQSDNSYWYWLESVDYSGVTELYGPAMVQIPAQDPGFIETPDMPHAYGLQQNYPNPFNPSTEISFTLRQGGPVELSVYNLKGQLLRTLIAGETMSGNQQHSVVWDGKDQFGNEVTSGIYLYKLRTLEKVYSKKMLLVK
jgi:hypothetical protein